MKEIQYKTFSWRTHKKNWLIKRPNVCQFELTFGCGLHCRHCYTDCYNKPAYLKKELNTEQVKFILDKVYNTGVIWACFTGGDPLTREDFLELYSYAKEKGFIVTVFTNAYSMTKKIADYLKKRPPFVIEVTLNAVTEDLYEKISQVRGSFKKAMKGIELILKAKLALKIKTQITKDNFKELPKIKKFIENLGLEFQPSFDLHARLNGDLAPCSLRITLKELLNLNGDKYLPDKDCRFSLDTDRPPLNTKNPTSNNNLFYCAVGGGDGIHLDPYGNTFPCNLIRRPSFSLLKVDIKYASHKLLPLVRGRKFTTNSKCSGCKLREFCHLCPGRAYVETGDMESPIEYYCELAKQTYLRQPVRPGLKTHLKTRSRKTLV